MLRSFAILATATLAIPAGQVGADTPLGAPPGAMVESSSGADCEAKGLTGQAGPIAPGPNAGHDDVSNLRHRLDQVLKERLANDRGAKPARNSASFRLVLAEYYACEAGAAAAILDTTTTSQCIAIYQAVRAHFLSAEEWSALRADPLGFGGAQLAALTQLASGVSNEQAGLLE